MNVNHESIGDPSIKGFCATSSRQARSSEESVKAFYKVGKGFKHSRDKCSCIDETKISESIIC